MSSTFTPEDQRSKWEVRISFADGDVHRVAAWSVSRDGAFKLALIDARMGHPFGSFMAPVVSWDAVPAEEVAA
jgi:hypothetical protein